MFNELINFEELEKLLIVIIFVVLVASLTHVKILVNLLTDFLGVTLGF